MTYIIAEPCVGVCDTACVEVCPVDCIHFTKDKDIGEEAKAEGFDPEEKQLYICLLYTSPSPRDLSTYRMPSSA